MAKNNFSKVQKEQYDKLPEKPRRLLMMGMA